MGDLSERDVEDVLEGVQPPGRGDLAHVVELTTWLHASREIEPPPAMRDDLFCQIEDGFGAYQRSSRRSPAHLRRHPVGRRRLVRETIAGSGRPIASVAAAAVLLVGVIVAVRDGGPAREPSAFVSPSAQGLRTTGGEAPSTSTTTAPTTTSPPETGSEPEAPGPTVTTSQDREQAATLDATTGSTQPSDTTSAGPQSQAGDDPTPSTTEAQPGGADDGDIAGSEGHPGGGRMQPSPQVDPADETTPWDLPLSGWDFDLSEWLPAKELWAAVVEAEGMDEAVDTEDDAGSDDDHPKRDRRGNGETKGDGNKAGEGDRQDDGDPEQEGSQAD
ncbi:MAG TPA: hypothetical protein VFH30_02925 [Acidimicrobiales bacterium]|nr:hypothetical protein [Acidimicrobiales bacterium]